MDAQQVGEPGPTEFAAASETFKLLADGTRLKIVWALLHQEHSVGELAAQVDARPAAVSQHLAKLRAAHLVRVRRDGNRMYYEAEDAHVRSLVEQTLRHATHLLPERPAGPPSTTGGQIRTVA